MPTTEGLKEKLEEVRCQIDSWRKTRISLQHVPQAIWEAAVELARMGGINPVEQFPRSGRDLRDIPGQRQFARIWPACLQLLFKEYT